MPDLIIAEALKLSPSLPRLDREVLLSHTLSQDRVFLMAHGETKLTPSQTKRYQSLLVRAKKHEPIAYLTGVREFYGRDFFVGPGVLIPRPETELLVDLAIKKISKHAHAKKKCAVIDVGTGTGAIIESVFLSLEFSLVRKNISWFAVDSEMAALRSARKNAKHHRISAIKFVRSDLLARLSKQLASYDELFVLANLPYLSDTIYQSTAPNVKRYEPKSALVSGKDGLDHYRRLVSELRAINVAGVKVNFFLEISPEQTKKLPALFADITTLSSLDIVPDLAGKSRLVIGVIEKTQNKSSA